MINFCRMCFFAIAFLYSAEIVRMRDFIAHAQQTARWHPIEH